MNIIYSEKRCRIHCQLPDPLSTPNIWAGHYSSMLQRLWGHRQNITLPAAFECNLRAMPRTSAGGGVGARPRHSSASCMAMALHRRPTERQNQKQQQNSLPLTMSIENSDVSIEFKGHYKIRVCRFCTRRNWAPIWRPKEVFKTLV
jgi:hypothetical protein